MSYLEIIHNNKKGQGFDLPTIDGTSNEVKVWKRNFIHKSM